MTDQELYQERISTLERENEDLRDLTDRLNKELRRCQIALGKEAPRSQEISGEEVLPPWASNTVFLSPLLLAYDSRIQELTSALDRAKLNIQELGESTKRLSAENSSLREEMERRWKEMLEKEKNELEGGHVGYAFYEAEKNEMQERLDLLSNENGLLLEQLEALKSRNEYLEKVTREKERAAEKYLLQLKEISGEYKQLLMAEDEVRGQKDIAEGKLKRVQEEFAKLEREREENITQVNKLQNELRLAQQSSQYYKKAYEEVDSKKSEEIEMLMQEAQNISAREKEAISRSQMQERELEDAHETASYYKKEYETLRAECDSMLKVMEDYEQKIATYQQKEESVHQQAREAKQKVEEAYLERDRIALREKQYVKQIERLQEQLKTELAEQKTNFNSLVDSLKKKHSSMLSNRDEELNNLQEKTNHLQVSFERLQRENSSLSKECERAKLALQEEQKTTQKRLEEYERRMRELEEIRLTEKRMLESQNEHLGYERQEWERLKKNYENMQHSSSKEIETFKNNSKRQKEEVRRLSQLMQDLQRERDNLTEELNQLRDSYYEKLQEKANDYNNKVYSLEQEIQEARERQKESEEKAFELLKAQERVSEKWKEEHYHTVSYFEQVVQDLNQEIRRLAKRNKELGDVFPVREISV
mgnify:FL=1